MQTHLMKCSVYRDVNDQMLVTVIEERKNSSSSLKGSVMSKASNRITSKQLKRTEFMDHDLPQRDVQHLNGLLLEYVAVCSVPFHAVEHTAFKVYIESLWPSCQVIEL